LSCIAVGAVLLGAAIVGRRRIREKIKMQTAALEDLARYVRNLTEPAHKKPSGKISPPLALADLEPLIAEVVESLDQRANPRPSVRAVSLLDAMPQMRLTVSDPQERKTDDDIDYGKMIEQELIKGTIKRSIYPDLGFDLRLRDGFSAQKVSREIDTHSNLKRNAG